MLLWVFLDRTFASGFRLSAEMNQRFGPFLLLWWQESWLVTTLGKCSQQQLGLAAGCFGKWSQWGLRIVSAVFFFFAVHRSSDMFPLDAARSQAYKSPCLELLHIQSLPPNELYKFNHVEGCLVCHHFLIQSVKEDTKLKPESKNKRAYAGFWK